MATVQRYIDVRHPAYISDMMYWDKWRECYEGGPDYVIQNLRRFSERETPEDFEVRKFFTPIPSYASAAINDIRNAIFQRLRDVTRRDGSNSYMRASAGEIGGVDNKGASMQHFIGITVLTELLVMGRCGVYVDMPRLNGNTLADVGDARPYVYHYPVEDILSWSAIKPEQPGEFQAVLLRDRGVDFNTHIMPGVQMPSGTFTRYRFMWLDPDTGFVKMRMYNDDQVQVTYDGTPTGEDVTLGLRRIPFTMVNINGSLLKNVYKHQVALLNLGSSDVAYALKSNFPFYTEQTDLRANGSHLKEYVEDDGTTSTTDNNNPGVEARIGSTHGRMYNMGADRPDFIHPSPEPLMASIKLQEKLEDDIRKLVNLEVQNKMGAKVTSAEAMKMSDQGLEAGLSFIGLVLESAERAIATFWAAYENSNPSQQQIATIKYPDRYSLKDDVDRIAEAKSLADLMYSVPGQTVKRELAKNIVTALLAGRVNVDRIDDIFKEIDAAKYTTSDPDTIIKAHEEGLVGDQAASMALGFDKDEYLTAREDHEERAKRILEAQTEAKMGEGEKPGARGVGDLSADPKEGSKERADATDTTLNADTKKPVRGEGKDTKEEDDD